MQELEVSKVDYENALSVSSDDDYELHLQRLPDWCFVNNYFESSILAWEANIDIQPVINHYKAVSYVAYLSMTEDECSHAMNQAVKEEWENKSNNYDQMKLIARVYSSKTECSVQEAVYHIIP